MPELDLFKLLTSDLVDELGWINDHQFCVWVKYANLEEFMHDLMKVTGSDTFVAGNIDANLQNYGICLVMQDVVDINWIGIFPPSQYLH